MAAYATYSDVQNRMMRVLSSDEQALCTTLLDDAALIIDSYNEDAETANKKIASCRMVIRALGNSDNSMPVGATQGTMSALGYSQTWTMGSGSTGELYLGKLEKKILGVGNKIGSHSPVEEL